MRVIPPLDITSARLTSTNVPDVPSGSAWSSGTTYAAGITTYQASTNLYYRSLVPIVNSTVSPADSVKTNNPVWVELGPNLWVSGTTYTVGQKVLRTETNKVYMCLVTTAAANTLLPEVGAVGSLIYWKEDGPSNKFAMFDYLRNSTTKGNSSINVRLTLGVKFNALALVGLKNVQLATIKVGTLANIDTTPTLTLTKNLSERVSLSWYDYFFDPITTAPSAVFFDLPIGTDYILDITLEGSNVECGGCIVGYSEDIGTVQRGAVNDAVNFSTVSRDTQGNASMVQRRNIPKTNQTLITLAQNVNTVRRVRDSLNAKPAVWVGLEDVPGQFYFESLLIVGFYTTFTISLDNPIVAVITLELQEI